MVNSGLMVSSALSLTNSLMSSKYWLSKAPAVLPACPSHVPQYWLADEEVSDYFIHV